MKAKELIEVLKDYPDYEVAVHDPGYEFVVPVNHVGTQGEGRRVLILDHEYEVCPDCHTTSIHPWTGKCENPECQSPGPDEEDYRAPYGEA